MNHSSLLNSPVIITPNNFTSLNRTPWAGEKLVNSIKKNMPHGPHAKIGEAWEFSCDLERPSTLLKDKQTTINQLIQEFPEEALSCDFLKTGRTCDILVKLINANSPLSLQIHPDDHHPSLSLNQSGKPESWLVVDAEPGAGIYLGFSQKFRKDELEHALKSSLFKPEWLNFVPIKNGDYFEIKPGVPHAIGPGSILFEPQKVTQGKSGVTWRMWDWNRLYNEQGIEDSKHGSPRTLNIEESVSLIDFSMPIGRDYVDLYRKKPRVVSFGKGSTIAYYPANDYYQTIKINLLRGDSLKIKKESHFGILSVLQGQGISFESEQCSSIDKLELGFTAFLASAALPLTIKSISSESMLTLVIPSDPALKKNFNDTFEF